MIHDTITTNFLHKKLANSLVSLSAEQVIFNTLALFFFASGDFCLLITFANSLDPDQDRQNVGPDLDPNCLTL